MDDRVLIIGSRTSGEKNDPAVIREYVDKNTSVECEQIYWEDILFDINAHASNVYVSDQPLDDAALAVALNWYKNGKLSIYRDVAYTLGLYLKSRDTKLWNSEIVHQRSTTKLSAMQLLAIHGISVPRTIFSLNSRLLCEYAIKNISFPLILKAVAASRGRDNFLVHTAQELESILLSAEGINKYMVQSYIPNDHDLRVICFDGKPQLILKRARVGDDTHLNNASLGSKTEWLELANVSPELLTKSEEICKIINREMPGIDFIPDIDSDFGYSCLEVNSIPQLTSGTDSDRKLTALSLAIKDNVKHTESR